MVTAKNGEEEEKCASSVMINCTIMKYENKEKSHIYVETLVGKNHRQRRKLHYEYTKYSRIENKL